LKRCRRERAITPVSKRTESRIGWFSVVTCISNSPYSHSCSGSEAFLASRLGNTIAAAKKEGRLNFYVGRYGSEPLLNEFRREFPEIKIVSTNGTGNSLGTRIVAEARAGNVLADLYSGGAVTILKSFTRERFSIRSSRY
jgi:hypothetical protein